MQHFLKQRDKNVKKSTENSQRNDWVKLNIKLNLKYSCSGFSLCVCTEKSKKKILKRTQKKDLLAVIGVIYFGLSVQAVYPDGHLFKQFRQIKSSLYGNFLV